MARVPLVRRVEEALFAKVVSKHLSKQRRAVLAEIRKDVPQMDELFWEQHREAMIADLTPILVDIYDKSVGVTVGQIKQEFIGELATRAVRWARQYAGELVRGLTNTTQRAVREAVATFISTPGMTFTDLKDMLSQTFSPGRAEMIAVTETTRAFYEGGKEAVEEIRRVGFDMVGIWRTAVDDRVCPICSPLEGLQENPSGGFGPQNLTPPAHPRCRCDIAYELT